MIVSCFKLESDTEVQSRCLSLGYSCQWFNVNQVRELIHSSAELVYMVPFAATLHNEWARLRVRLAMANRLYLVAGRNLKTAEIMAAARDGAYDVLDLNEDDARWRQGLDAAVTSQDLWLRVYGGAPLKSEELLLGESAAINSLRQAVSRLGPTNATVLIMGPSGVGKERVALALHAAGGRGPFVPVNCAAIPKDLLEAELFGAEKGAFTGAIKTRIGLVQQAAGGTLFLDEVGELDLSLQPKLLRFFETRRARRVGGNEEYAVELRLVTATNRRLEEAVTAGTFRADLYYRLSEIILQVPPLKARPSDIPHLALTFMSAANERFGKNFERLEPELILKFQQYDWPGNVRELKSAIDRLTIYYDGPVMRAAWWQPTRAGGLEAEPGSTVPVPEVSLAAAAPAPGATHFPNAKAKQKLAARLLQESDGNLGWVAAQLGIHPTTLYRWRKSGSV